MKIKTASLLLVGISLLLLVSSPVQAEEPPVTPEATEEPPVLANGASEDDPFDLKDVVGPSAITAGPVGKQINVAVSNGTDRIPAVAHCASDQYLVVYWRDDAIYGQRLERDGGLLGSAFVISGGSHMSADADVACDWGRNQFIVVWQYDWNGDQSD